MADHWFVRATGEHDVYGRLCYEVAHTARPDVIVITDRCNAGHAARVANALNTLDRNSDAPRFDERTGLATVAG